MATKNPEALVMIIHRDEDDQTDVVYQHAAAYTPEEIKVGLMITDYGVTRAHSGPQVQGGFIDAQNFFMHKRQFNASADILESLKKKAFSQEHVVYNPSYPLMIAAVFSFRRAKQAIATQL